MMTGNWIEAKCQKFNKSHGIVKGIQNITLTAPKTQKEQKLFTFENKFKKPKTTTRRDRERINLLLKKCCDSVNMSFSTDIRAKLIFSRRHFSNGFFIHHPYSITGESM